MQEVQDGPRWMLHVGAGADLFRELTDFARRHEIRAASVVEGIGMLSSATLGFWNGREYAPRELRQPHELVALHGSIADVDGAPSLHLHAGLGSSEHQLVGGHLLQATVGILVEAYVETFPGRRFGRPLDESLGLRRIDLCPSV